MSHRNLLLTLLLIKLLPAYSQQDTAKRGTVIYSGMLNMLPAGSPVPAIGFINLTMGDAGSVNVGFVNLVKGKFSGPQIGFINAVSKDISGLQTGFVNLAGGKMRSAQVGFVNISGKAAAGAAVGFVNVTGGDMHGASIGFINAVAHRSSGPVIGFVNTSKAATGLHLGFINVIDSLEGGLPVGLLSFVRRNGYHVLEAGANEISPVNASYKVGIRELYTVLTASFDPFSTSSMYGYAAGLGTHITMGNQFALSVEGTEVARRDGDLDGHKFFYFTRLALGAVFKLNPRLGIVAGPSLSYFVQSRDKERSAELPDKLVLLERQSRDHYHLLWLGGQAGLRVSLGKL